MQDMIGFILAAGEGERSKIKGIAIHKGNYPLPDGTTPMSRIAEQMAQGGIKKIFVVMGRKTPDFEALRNSAKNVQIELLDDCYGDKYPVLSLSKALSKIQVAHNTECIVTMCDIVYTAGLSDLIAYTLREKELVLGWGNNRFAKCAKAHFSTLCNLCQDKKFSGIYQLIEYHENEGGSVSKIEVNITHLGSVEEYTRFLINTLAAKNLYLAM